MVRDAIWTRTSETAGVTRKAWKVPVTSSTTTRTGDVTKNMQANNALICSGKKDNRSRKVKVKKT